MISQGVFDDDRTEKAMNGWDQARLNRALKDTRCPVHGQEARVVRLDKVGWRFENCCCLVLLKAASQALAACGR
ncbi:MAG: hypothetical protein L0Y44_04005 [Phycisphaerales bacterium]|nr:hypothetical protein [Phycisphaerales bacterium]